MTTDPKRFSVLVNGRNFLLLMEGHKKKMGFFITRLVEAKDADQAELAAVSSLQAEPKLREMVRNTMDDPPILFIEEVEEIRQMNEQAMVEHSYIFYDENERVTND